MNDIRRPLTASLILLTVSLRVTQVPSLAGSKAPATIEHTHPVLWKDPTNITSRDLYYGPGGKTDEPQGPFTFVSEDAAGSSPKFTVVDANDVRWKVKMGDEARPETVASRLVWAVGYFANEDYFMPVLHVQNMQPLHRGGNLVSRDGTVNASV